MLAILIGNAITGAESQILPPGSQEIITELAMQMISEDASAQDLITE
jgi:hypothetical protein|tara:strand:+ start:420 stop:560 length:141 start_codon:yes stop_codon:yes gene_type:complete